MFTNVVDSNDFSIEIESLYISHVFPNIHKKKIAQLFEKLLLARIAAIDFVAKVGKDGKPYNSAYIHVDYWFDNTSAKNFQEKIRSSAKEALLVYDEPWYWIVNENTSSDKKKCIKMAEEAKIERTKRKVNNNLIEMEMMLDALERMCEKVNYLKENWNITSEDLEDQDYYEKEAEIFLKNIKLD
jgi:hypothetical protein